MKGSNWSSFGKFLLIRTKSPFKSPRFLLYFVFIVFIVGSVGIIFELLSRLSDNSNINFGSLIVNIANVFLAYIAASSVELILLNENETQIKEIEIKDVQMLGVSFLVLGFILWILSIYFQNSFLGLYISGFGLLTSYFVWWISNAEKPQLNGQQNPFATIGNKKDTSDTILDLKGNLQQFKTS